MITKITLSLRCPQQPNGNEWAYMLYAALLRETSTEFAANIHESTAAPISQYVVPAQGRLCWQVGLLGEACERELLPVLLNKESYCLGKAATELTVEKAELERIFMPQELVPTDLCGQAHELELCTPAAFKQQGRFVNRPEPRLIVQNLVRRWNGCLPEWSIGWDDAQITEVADALRLRGLRVQDQPYGIKGNAIPGFVGTMQLENTLDDPRREILDELLAFAVFSGLGVKTALGMGGIRHRCVLPANKQ